MVPETPQEDLLTGVSFDQPMQLERQSDAKMRCFNGFAGNTRAAALLQRQHKLGTLIRPVSQLRPD